MNITDLQVLTLDQTAFKKAFRKVDSANRTFSTDDKNPIVTLLKGKFGPGRTPYMHQVTLPDGTRIVLKFTNTIKEVLNSKGKAVAGKESFLSYFEVIVSPVGQKAYMYSQDVTQTVWGTSRSKAELLHQRSIDELVQFAATFGIDLTAPDSWNTVFTQTY